MNHQLRAVRFHRRRDKDEDGKLSIPVIPLAQQILAILIRFRPFFERPVLL